MTSKLLTAYSPIPRVKTEPERACGRPTIRLATWQNYEDILHTAGGLRTEEPA